MGTLNKVIIIGNVGNDPETRTMPNGESVTNMSVATTDVWKDKNGVKQEKTEWHRVVLFRKLSEITSEYVKKGRLVCIEGKLETRKWEDREGVTHYTTEIIATELKMLGHKSVEVDEDVVL